jgi:hypothetical protein
MSLKTDYKDDVLDLTVNSNRKFNMTTNQDGSVSFEDVTVYEQEGDTFGHEALNATNGAINILIAQLDGYSIVVCPEADKGSDPKTLYFCY